MDQHSIFWDDLACDLEDPEFVEEFIAATREIERIDIRYRPT